jgi:Rrf2 family protein
MAHLAKAHGESVVKRHDIIEAQGIPEKYLDHIMLKLRQGNLVLSQRGRFGGYRLSQDPAQISVWEIFEAVEENIYPVKCIDHGGGCSLVKFCGTHEPWQYIFESVRKTLEGISLAWVSLHGTNVAPRLLTKVNRECPSLEELRIS